MNFEVGVQANLLADRIRKTVRELGYQELVTTTSNQVFPILPDVLLAELGKHFSFTEMHRVDDQHRCVRFCTSWATNSENVDLLCDALCSFGK